MAAKIVQIVVRNNKLVALCEDGTLWEYQGENNWVQLK